MSSYTEPEKSNKEVLAKEISRLVRGYVHETVKKGALSNTGSVNLNIEIVQLDVHISVEMMNIDKPRPVQEKYRHIYTILAFISGAIFLLILIAVSVFVPNPTPSQLRIWLPILAVSAAAFGTVITGMLNVKASFRKQISVGGAGALAILVIFYVWNPAILE